MSKDIDHILRKVRRQGFTVRKARGSQHWRITATRGASSGETRTIPGTPGDNYRGIANIKAKLRQIGAKL